MADQGKRRGTIVHTEQPFNAEPSRAALAETAVTPLDACYVRSHGPIAEIAWTRVTVEATA